ncbi:MAG: glycosyltransferase [Anaerolineae bacterium]
MEASTPARSVLMIIRRFPPMMSGKGYQMLTLSPALEARNVKVTVLTINPGAAPRKEHYPGADVVRVNANLNGSGQILFALWNLWHILSNRGKYDLVHLQSLSGLHVPFAVLAAKLTGLSAIGELSLLGSDDPLSLEKTQLGRLILRAVRQLNRIVYMSAPLKESCLRAYL